MSKIKVSIIPLTELLSLERPAVEKDGLTAVGSTHTHLSDKAKPQRRGEKGTRQLVPGVSDQVSSFQMQQRPMTRDKKRGLKDRPPSQKYNRDNGTRSPSQCLPGSPITPPKAGTAATAFQEVVVGIINADG